MAKNADFGNICENFFWEMVIRSLEAKEKHRHSGQWSRWVKEKHQAFSAWCSQPSFTAYSIAYIDLGVLRHYATSCAIFLSVLGRLSKWFTVWAAAMLQVGRNLLAPWWSHQRGQYKLSGSMVEPPTKQTTRSQMELKTDSRAAI